MAIMPRTNPLSIGRLQETPPEPLRRCTFRLITTVTHGRGLPTYDVACTFPDRRVRIALGDVEDARPICNACTYRGIFRPDAD